MRFVPWIVLCGDTGLLFASRSGLQQMSLLSVELKRSVFGQYVIFVVELMFSQPQSSSTAADSMPACQLPTAHATMQAGVSAAHRGVNEAMQLTEMMWRLDVMSEVG